MCTCVLQFLSSKFKACISANFAGVAIEDISDEMLYSIHNLGELVNLRRLLNSVQSHGLNIAQVLAPSLLDESLPTDNTIEVCNQVFVRTMHKSTLISYDVGGIASLIQKGDSDGYYSPGNAMDIKLMLDTIGYKAGLPDYMTQWYDMCLASSSSQEIIIISATTPATK